MPNCCLVVDVSINVLAVDLMVTIPVVEASDVVTPSVVGSCVVDNLVLSSCSVVVSWVVSLDVSSGVTAVDSLDVNSITVVVTSLTAVVWADVTPAVVVAGPKIQYVII